MAEERTKVTETTAEDFMAVYNRLSDKDKALVNAEVNMAIHILRTVAEQSRSTS